MTLSKAFISQDKRQSISKTFSWLPSPTAHPSSTPILNKKLGFFSKFCTSSTELDQIFSSDDDEEEEEGTPTTPRDSLHQISSKLDETPPVPPQHASLNQYVQTILAFTFDQVDEHIEKEWDQDRQRLELDLSTPAPYQFS